MEWIDRLREVKPLVTGEAITDEYRFCTVIGQSNKDHAPYVKINRIVSYHGGCLAVYNQALEFCKSAAVQPGHSICKVRYIEEVYNRKMFELFLPRGTVSGVPDSKTGDDLVIVCDYGHGFFGDSEIERTLATHPKVALNVQTNGENAGFNYYTRWPIRPYLLQWQDQREVCLAHQERDEVSAYMEFLKNSNATYRVVSRGEKGILVWGESGALAKRPSFPVEIVDRMGAGDAAYAVGSLLAYVGCPIGVMACVCNAVGAIACTILGNERPVTRDELEAFLHERESAGQMEAADQRDGDMEPSRVIGHG